MHTPRPTIFRPAGQVFPISHVIVHRATWEYLAVVSEIDDEAEAKKLRREIFETWSSSVLTIYITY